MEFMLANGHSRTWMIGNTIVTITTSGTYIRLDGVCDNCLALRRRTENITLKEKAKGEKNLKQRITIGSGSKEDSASQASSDHTRGAVASHVTGTQTSASSQASTEESSKPENKFTSLDKTALHKSHSVDTAKLKSMSEARGSVSSERRHSEPLVPVSPQNCQCVCQGWAEIFIRRPSGNISWIMRIQNRSTSSCLDGDVSMAVVDDPQIGESELITLLLTLKLRFCRIERILTTASILFLFKLFCVCRIFSFAQYYLCTVNGLNPGVIS